MPYILKTRVKVHFVGFKIEKEAKNVCQNLSTKQFYNVTKYV